ncbi:SIMPL domain-containing protein [soil metagenome]
MKASKTSVVVLLTFCILFIVNHSILAQNENSSTKKIEVIGSAEMEVIPDEIYLSISLREYMKDLKNKVSIDKLERDLYAAVNKIGVPKEDFQIENVYGYNWHWDKKRKEDFMASKRYRLKLSDLNKVNDLLSQLDPKGVENMNIGQFSHSKIEQYRLELKANALQAAKAKADFLLKSIDEQAGRVLEIQEMYDGYSQPVYEMRESNFKIGMDQDVQQPEIDFKKIKLRYEMKAVFAII